MNYSLMPMVRIGNKLKQMRLEKNYSQEYIAHELGMSQSNYCKLESDHHFPSGEVIEKIADFYKVSPQELLASEGQQVQFNSNHDNAHSVNAFMVWQDPQKIIEDLLSSKEKIISLQAKQIEMMEEKLKEAKNR